MTAQIVLEKVDKVYAGGVKAGRAIVREPQAFLTDEPLSNLDAKLRVSMRSSLSQLHEQLHVIRPSDFEDAAALAKDAEEEDTAIPMDAGKSMWTARVSPRSKITTGSRMDSASTPATCTSSTRAAAWPSAIRA